PHVGRVCGDLPGAAGHDRLVEVRSRERPALRQLHGPLRLRANGGAHLDELAAAVAARLRLAGPGAYSSSAIIAAAGAAPSLSTGRYSTSRPISSAIATAMDCGVSSSKRRHRPAP